MHAGTSTLGQATTPIISVVRVIEEGVRRHECLTISPYIRTTNPAFLQSRHHCKLICISHRKPSMWSYPQALLLTVKIKYRSKMSAFSCSYHVKICLYFFSLTLQGAPFPPLFYSSSLLIVPTHRPYTNTSILHNHPFPPQTYPPPISSPSPFQTLDTPLAPSIHETSNSLSRLTTLTRKFFYLYTFLSRCLTWGHSRCRDGEFLPMLCCRSINVLFLEYQPVMPDFGCMNRGSCF